MYDLHAYIYSIYKHHVCVYIHGMKRFLAWTVFYTCFRKTHIPPTAAFAKEHDFPKIFLACQGRIEGMGPMDILVLSSWLWQWFFFKVFLLPQKIELRRATIRITSFSQNCEYELFSGKDYGFTMFWWFALIFFGHGSSQHIETHSKIGMRQRAFKFHTMFLFDCSRAKYHRPKRRKGILNPCSFQWWELQITAWFAQLMSSFVATRRKVSTSYDTLGRIKRRSELGGSKILHTAIGGS